MVHLEKLHPNCPEQEGPFGPSRWKGERDSQHKGVVMPAGTRGEGSDEAGCCCV